MLFDFGAILSTSNLVLSSAIVITAFSLLLYILTHNLHSPVARSFCALLAFVILVYFGDVVLLALYRAGYLAPVLFWLKFQWIGIVFVPAAYLHFSDSLLKTTNSISTLRRLSVYASYGASLVLLLFVFFSEAVVRDGVFTPQASHLAAGPLFWAFALYFFITALWGALNIHRARQRCLTSTSRRRMTYLAASFAAPGLAVFPYLIVASVPKAPSPILVNLMVLIGNVGIGFMIVVMAYSVAYFGALTPDRVIKHSLIHFLLRGPFAATCVVLLILAVSRVESILNLPRDTALIFIVVASIVLLEIFISLSKPFIDRLIYRQDREEITWIQELDKRLLTTTDLKQFLENILVAICEILRVRVGFVAVLEDGKLRLESWCGPPEGPAECLARWDVASLSQVLNPRSQENTNGPAPVKDEDFVVKDGFWLLPLRTRAGDAAFGLLALEGRASNPELNERERKALSALISQAEAALEDRHLQKRIFSVLERIIPEIEQVQLWRSEVHYSGSPVLEEGKTRPLYTPDFTRWVKEALSHYWGGPKLTESPLLSLKVVEEARLENGGTQVNALRTVLHQAVEKLKPEGQRSMTAAEWILYNILDLKFIQGRRVKDIATRLAMSESDLYRKQRVAIEEVAKAIAEMEMELEKS